MWKVAVGAGIALFVYALSGCSSGRWSLTRQEPPAAVQQEEVEIKYGNPWGKKKTDDTDGKPSKSQGLPPELEQKLAEARQRQQEKKKKDEIANMLLAAAEAEQREDLSSARQHYERILQLDPQHPEAHHRLAVVADQQRDTATADRHYAEALKLKPRDADLLGDVGYSYFLRGNLTESERYLKQALEVNPYHHHAIWHLGQIYLRQGKREQALAMIRKIKPEREAQQIVASAFGEPPSSQSRVPQDNLSHHAYQGMQYGTATVTPFMQERSEQGHNPASQASTMQDLRSDLIAALDPPTALPPSVVQAPQITPWQRSPSNDSPAVSEQQQSNEIARQGFQENTPPAARSRPAMLHQATSTTSSQAAEALRQAAQLALSTAPSMMFPAMPTTISSSNGDGLREGNLVIRASGIEPPKSDVRWAWDEHQKAIPSLERGSRDIQPALWWESAQPPPKRIPEIVPAGGTPPQGTSNPSSSSSPSIGANLSPRNTWTAPAPPSVNWFIPQDVPPTNSNNFSPVDAGSRPIEPSSSIVTPPLWPKHQEPVPSEGYSVTSPPVPARSTVHPTHSSTERGLSGGSSTTIPNWPYTR